MDAAKYSYTIGIKRRFLPGYTKYKVLKHRNEVLPGGDPRIIMDCADGTIIGIPGIANRAVKLYPDYSQALIEQKRLTAKKEPPAITEEIPEDADRS